METRKVLGQVVTAVLNTEYDLYTVPALTETVASSIVVCRRGGANNTFRISVSVGGGATATKDYLFYDTTIGANATFTVVIGMTLSATDVVRIYGSSNDFTFTMFGIELT